MPKFIFKANNDVISHCTCDGNVPAMSSAQLDCLWCGCGWLIPCSKCKKSYTYGIILETDIDIVEIGRCEAKARGIDDVSEQDIQEWADSMEEAIEPFDIGQIVVYLDGFYWPVDAKDISFDGYFAHHELKALPHADALKDPDLLDKMLGDSKYWWDRELPNRD